MGTFFKKSEPINILLIEDNPAHAELIKIVLHENSVKNAITHLADGETAMDYLFKRGNYSDNKNLQQPHLILLDLRLPKIDGLDLLKEIKNSADLKHIPVIILTTSDEEADIAKAYDNHVNSYLVKPLEFEKFSALMTRFGFYWLDSNVFPSKK
ncbi:MAG: response regulator [Candidatus Omnitrophica bacterium]|nr:response regulator [Candidatus Omnitrophota bacterium]